MEKFADERLASIAYLSEDIARQISSTKGDIDDLVEMVEIPDHPWFLASQFHPEFTSNPRDGHPLFIGFITAAREHHDGAMPKAVEA